MHVVKDYPYTFTPLSDEGRGMLQIVHDIAPGADLAFRTGYISPVDMAAGIVELADNGCNIIVDDISYITEPFYKDGLISNAVDNVVNRGVTYFSAAGNFGKKSYSSVFTPARAQGPAGLSGAFHDFGNGDIYQRISLTEGNYLLVMQWDDSNNALNDYDIYLANDNGTTLFGFNRNNTGTAPIEILPFTVKGGGASTNILITRASGTQNSGIKYVVFRGDMAILEYNTGNSTIVGQANSAGAITVGAVLYSNTPYYGVNPPTIASFSSVGGTLVNGIVRQKPDFTAPNGVNTTVALSPYDLDSDGNYEFYGTSAAAPHAAAVAALLSEAKKKFSTEVVTPAAVRQLLQTTALNMDQTGFDYNTGYGFIQADAAILTFASPKPNLSELVVPVDVTKPGTTPFTVTVKGNYLTKDTRITLNGNILPTTIISSTEAQAQVPVFSGNPALNAITPPKSSSQLDGGSSDPLYFYSIVKKKITITADSFIKKFGTPVPAFTFTMKLDGVPDYCSGSPRRGA